MKYQCAYLVSSLLFVSTCLFVSPVYAVSDLLETSVKNVTSKSVEISFTPFRESKSSCIDNGFWYNYQLLNGEKKVIKTGLNSTPYFELYDLKPNTDYGYYVRAVKVHIDDKNYCGRSRVGTSVSITFEDVAISNPVLFTTKPATSMSNVSDELEVNDYVDSPLIFEKYAYISAQFSYRTYDMQGKSVGGPKKVDLDLRYDDDWESTESYDLHNGGDTPRDWNDTHLRLSRGDGASIDFSVFGSSSPFVYNLDRKISSPQEIRNSVSLMKQSNGAWNSHVSLNKKGQKFVVYDPNMPTRYYLFTLKSIRKSKIVPPRLRAQFSELNEAPYLLWIEDTYKIDSIKNMLVEYRCLDCEDERLRITQQVSVPYNTLRPSGWQNYLVPEKEGTFLDKTIQYRVRTNFSSGKTSPWALWEKVKVVEHMSYE